MRNLTSCLLLLAFVLALPACTMPGVTAEPSPAPTAEPTFAATSTHPEPTLPPAETPTLLDSCLIGVWTMDTYALNNKFLDLTQSPTMYILAPSSMTIEFRDDNIFAIDGQVSIHFDIPNTSNYMELDGYHQGSGSYAADGSLLTFIATENVVDYGPMRVYINGELAEGAFNTGSPPENMMSPPANAPYRCSGNLLEITFDGPLGPVTEEWRK